MTISTLPLSYCTNVHPGRTLDEVRQGLRTYTSRLQAELGRPVAAGLWLAAPVVRELLAQPTAVENFAKELESLGLSCYTLNGFPFGDFHSARVKENVYLPDWTTAERLDYTIGCAEILARLLPDGAEGSISTVPLGFKGFAHPLDFADQCAERLFQLARRLEELAAQTGRMIRLAIEPEPFCVLETTPETLAFFARLWERTPDARTLDAARRHLGVCYDVCHQAVEFEDVPTSIGSLARAGIRINKVHITCAIEIESPATNPDALAALARYVEPRYLHQTIGRTSSGSLVRSVDLSQALTAHSPPEYLEAQAWRVHFHVPVNAERLGPLGTTRAQIAEALTAVAALEYATHLEVETYTWEVLPEAPTKSPDLVAGLSRELGAASSLIEAAQKKTREG
ncbi:MAG TPA: metabolite traffic protein EboE [Planctomycetaceae bacterium]|nr:metabolite traffic protein EboE [Planctomycetaceae bacterium]